jgi:hypothetical protein
MFGESPPRLQLGELRAQLRHPPHRVANCA